MDSRVVSWLLAGLLVLAVASGWFGISHAERQAIEATARLDEQRKAREEAEALAGVAAAQLEAVLDSLDRVMAQAAIDQARAQEAAATASAAFARAEHNARAVTQDTPEAALIDSLVAAHNAQVSALTAENDALRRERDVLLARIDATDAARSADQLVIERLHAELATAIERGDAWQRAAKPGIKDWVQRLALVVLVADKLLQ